MLARQLLTLRGSVLPGTPGMLALTQRRAAVSNDVDPVLTSEELSMGILKFIANAAPIDATLPSGTVLLQSFPELGINDAFELTLVNDNDDTVTIVESTDGTFEINADSYTVMATKSTMFALITVLSENKKPTSFAVTATNASAVLSAADPNALLGVGVGMAVVVGATTSTVLAVNLQNGTVTMADAFGGTTGSGQEASFSPRVDFLGYTVAPQS